DGPAGASRERAEHVRVLAGGGHPEVSVRGNHLRLEQPGGRYPIRVRPGTETAALKEAPGDPYRHAAAPGYVAAVLASGLIRLEPPGAGLDGDRGGCRRCGGTARGHERVVHRDPAHAMRPQEDGPRRVRPAQVVLAGALHHEFQAMVACEP